MIIPVCRKKIKQIESFLSQIEHTNYPIKISSLTRIDSLSLDEQNQNITIDFSKTFSYAPFREKNVRILYDELKNSVDGKYRNYHLVMRSLGQSIENLIPNYYRKTFPADSSRLPFKTVRPVPIVRPVGLLRPKAGLYGNNVALWPSHGWYFNQEQDRWMWQRPRMFGAVEDLLPESFVIPFIIPMLENAGANVFIPRERDIRPTRIIVDNDAYRTGVSMFSYAENHTISSSPWKTGPGKGYAIETGIYPVNYNPFQAGTYRYCKADTLGASSITWTPLLPDSGYYAVYVSWHRSANNISDAHYSVKHLGGTSEFLVNQQIGGNTWIYLGTFKFAAGRSPARGSVTLSNKSADTGFVTADAVKFGGGMGSVLRNGRTSGRPAFEEGARYWLQTAGFPDTLVYSINNNQSDYKDDYQSRGEWVDYMKGAPYGPNKNRKVPGLGIPVDLSLAFHTDAGLTRGDTTIGTLSIYSLTGADTQRVFPDGVSRLASRDFADILQSQITADIRRLYNPKWNRRSLRDAQYSEAFRPNVPAALLELLSHENFTDMKYALDPRFRFDVSRAIYKAMLRFIANRENRPYVVQPLPVTRFSACFNDEGALLLNWEPQYDPLEKSAAPRAYKVFQRLDDGGFDSGKIYQKNRALIKNIRPGIIYSFKVSAINDGGESLPSEILAVCRVKDAPTLLIVNGFTRVAPPAALETGDFSGFDYAADGGVPYKYDLKFTGNQFDFNKKHSWVSDDNPGHGASYANDESRVEAGNTFDFCYAHGRAMLQAGYGFVSASRQAVMDGIVPLNPYPVVDLILGEQKRTNWPTTYADSLHGIAFRAFPGKLKRTLKAYLLSGKGALFVSGAYVGSDLFRQTRVYPDQVFGRDILKIKGVSDHAARNGEIMTVATSPLRLPARFHFNQKYTSRIYRVEAPDAFLPENGAVTVLRYAENRFSAGTAYKGTDYHLVVFGFPFETILGSQDRNKIMKGVLDYLLH